MIMDSFQFVENQLYPSAPISNDDVDLSIKVSSSHRDNEYFDNASYKEINTNPKTNENSEQFDQNSKKRSYGCLVSSISLWIVVDVALGASQIALGVWMIIHIKDTITLSSTLIALGISWILRSIFIVVGMCTGRTLWFYGFYLLISGSFIVLPPTVMWWHLLEAVIDLHKKMS